MSPSWQAEMTSVSSEMATRNLGLTHQLRSPGLVVEIYHYLRRVFLKPCKRWEWEWDFWFNHQRRINQIHGSNHLNPNAQLILFELLWRPPWDSWWMLPPHWCRRVSHRKWRFHNPNPRVVWRDVKISVLSFQYPLVRMYTCYLVEKGCKTILLMEEIRRSPPDMYETLKIMGYWWWPDFWTINSMKNDWNLKFRNHDLRIWVETFPTSALCPVSDW